MAVVTENDVGTTKAVLPEISESTSMVDCLREPELSRGNTVESSRVNHSDSHDTVSMGHVPTLVSSQVDCLREPELSRGNTVESRVNDSDSHDIVSMGHVPTLVSSQDEVDKKPSSSSSECPPMQEIRSKNKIGKSKNKPLVLPVDISRADGQEQQNFRTSADIVQAAVNMSAGGRMNNLIDMADEQSEEDTDFMMPILSAPSSQVRQLMRSSSVRASSMRPGMSGRRQVAVSESSDSDMDIPNMVPLHDLANHRASSLAAGRRRIQASMTRVESVKTHQVTAFPATPESRYWSRDTKTLGFNFEDSSGASPQQQIPMSAPSSSPRVRQRSLSRNRARTMFPDAMNKDHPVSAAFGRAMSRGRSPRHLDGDLSPPPPPAYAAPAFDQAQQEFGYPQAGGCYDHANGMYTGPEQAFFAGGSGRMLPDPMSALQPYGAYMPQNQEGNFFGMGYAQAPQMMSPDANFQMQAMPPYHQGSPDYLRGRPERWNTSPVADDEEVFSGAGTGIFASRAVAPLPPARRDFSPPRAGAKPGSTQRSAGQGPVTTIMLRNIPQKYDREMLLEDMNSRGFEGAYDFFYLPIDFSTTHTVGYAFINFVSEAHLAKFAAVYVGLKLREDSPKVISICDAKLQGKLRNVEFYRNSTVMGMDEQYHPLLFKKGVRFPFPPPTRTLGPVQRRPARAGGNVKTQSAQSSTNQGTSWRR